MSTSTRSRREYAGTTARVLGQLPQVPSERDQVEVVADHDGRHAGAAFRAGNRHPVNDRIDHAGARGDRLGNLRGRYILALPAEGVTDAIDEVEIALLIPSHQVTGAKPGVARLEDVAEDLLLGRLLACVAFESGAEARRVRENLADRFSDFVWSAANAPSLFVPDRLVFVAVDFHQRRPDSMRKKRRDTADGARLALDIEQRQVAFGRGVELQNLRNAEPPLEVVPHIRPQPVAATHPDPVL